MPEDAKNQWRKVAAAALDAAERVQDILGEEPPNVPEPAAGQEGAAAQEQGQAMATALTVPGTTTARPSASPQISRSRTTHPNQARDRIKRTGPTTRLTVNPT